MYTARFMDKVIRCSRFALQHQGVREGIGEARLGVDSCEVEQQVIGIHCIIQILNV